jgi:hypothetical protein
MLCFGSQFMCCVPGPRENRRCWLADSVIQLLEFQEGAIISPKAFFINAKKEPANLWGYIYRHSRKEIHLLKDRKIVFSQIGSENENKNLCNHAE